MVILLYVGVSLSIASDGSKTIAFEDYRIAKNVLSKSRIEVPEDVFFQLVYQIWPILVSLEDGEDNIFSFTYPDGRVLTVSN